METILSTLPSERDGERLLVVLVQTGEGSLVEMRQQSFGEGIGWFTQNSVRMEPGQVAALRGVLGTGGASRPRAELPREFSRVEPAAWQPRLVRADSA